MEEKKLNKVIHILFNKHLNFANLTYYYS